MTHLRMVVLGVLAGVLMVVGVTGTTSARAATGVTPGWECVPTAAGKAVVSGGTGASPSCGASSTPVLAPTYVASGIGSKPTVEFSAVNLQVVDGGGATSSVNGTGNVVIGYAENTNNHARTGSHNLIVGPQNGWTGYGELVAGHNNVVSGLFAVAFGNKNTVSGSGATVTGGENNNAGSVESAITGGCGNLTGPGAAMNPSCPSSGTESILGGVSNRANGQGDTVGGGDFNTTGGTETSIAGGESNSTSSFFSTVAGGLNNDVSGEGSAIAGGLSESQSGTENTQVGSSFFTP